MPKDKDLPPPVKKKKTDKKGLDWEGDIDFQVYGQVSYKALFGPKNNCVPTFNHNLEEYSILRIEDRESN